MATKAAAKSPSDDANVVMEVRRELHLDPVARCAPTWKPRQPLVRCEPQPFDRKHCLARLKKVWQSRYGQVSWERAQLADGMTPEEAAFWLQAMLMRDDKDEPAKYHERVAAAEPLKTPRRRDVTKYLSTTRLELPPEIMLPLGNLIPLEDLVDALISCDRGGARPAYFTFRNAVNLMCGFRQFIVPYLTDDDAAMIRERVEGKIEPAAWPQGYYEVPNAAYHLAAFAGHPRLINLVESWPDGTQRDMWPYQMRQLIVTRLPSADLVNHHMRRLKLGLADKAYMADWLATTEYAGLDYLAEDLAQESDKTSATRLVEFFASSVIAPEAAEPMLQLVHGSKAAGVASQWLNRYVGCAIAGLIPVAGEGRGRGAEAALGYLREQERLGHGELIEQHLQEQPAELADRIRRLVLGRDEAAVESHDASTVPQPLAAALNEPALGKRRAKLPPWLAVRALPPILVAGRKLSDEHVESVLKALQASTLDAPHPLIAELRQHAQPESLEAFAWRLFERWLETGGESKEKWCMGSIGLLGGDHCALKITPLLRAWPGESLHARAVFGLECLKAIGSDTALMQLNGIAQKLKFKGLKDRARLFMHQIAADRGLSAAQLADRIVPDCGLDERGQREFDFGPRKFFVFFAPGLKPMIKDETGKVRPDLPKPAAKDDAEKAKAAVDQWKLMKKQLRETVKVQVPRLEQAMVTGRRWKPAEFQTLLVKHPLMTHLAQTLLWGGYDAQGRLAGTFRLTSEQDFADSEDNACTIDQYAAVGVVHPAHLSEDGKAAWSEIFADYELIPPFDQLTRRVYTLEPGEEQQHEITRFDHVKIEPRTMLGILERLDWTRGPVWDAGWVHQHLKPFAHADVTAVLEYKEGYSVGYMEGADYQTLTECYFLPRILAPEQLWQVKKRLRLGEIDPVVISEVLRDLHVLAAKSVQ